MSHGRRICQVVGRNFSHESNIRIWVGQGTLGPLEKDYSEAVGFVLIVYPHCLLFFSILWTKLNYPPKKRTPYSTNPSGFCLFLRKLSGSRDVGATKRSLKPTHETTLSDTSVEVGIGNRLYTQHSNKTIAAWQHLRVANSITWKGK